MVVNPKNPAELNKMLTKKPLAIYGLGGMGKRIIEYCDANNIKIGYYVDKNIYAIKGKSIITPNQITTIAATANLIIASPMNYEEMVQIALSQGVKKNNILSYELFLQDEITWEHLDEKANWDKMKNRVATLAKWISPDTKSIIDYGAGPMHLKNYLPATTMYYPIDYKKRSEEIIVCDLNSLAFPDIYTEVSFVSAVIELLLTSKEFIAHMCSHTTHNIICSYMVSDVFSNVTARRASGYLNDYTSKQFVEIFAKNGFTLVETTTCHMYELEACFLFARI